MTAPHWKRVHWPQPLPAAQAVELLRRLAAERDRAPLMLEAIGQGGQVRHRIGTSANAAEGVLRMLRALVGGVDIEPDRIKTPDYGMALKLQLRGASLGLDTRSAETVSRAILAALSEAGEDEALMLQVTIGTGRAPSLLSEKPFDPTQGFLSQLLLGSRAPSTEVTRRLRTKAAEPKLDVRIRLAASAGTKGRMRALLSGLVAALRTATGPGTRMDFSAADVTRLEEPLVRYRAELATEELVGLLGLPLDSDAMPGMPPRHPKQLRPSPRLTEQARVFGVSTAPGEEIPLGLSIEDSTRHLSITGPNGSGKSVLVSHLIEADIRAGRSVVVMDAKAELALDLVLSRIPEQAQDKVVVLDPAMDFPPGLNVLAGDGRSTDLRVDDIVGVIRDLYSNYFGPRTADVLLAALSTIAPIPGATIAWLPRLLSEPGFRARIMPEVRDDYLRQFWASYDAMSEHQQAQYAGPVLSRLRQFLLRPQLRRPLDQAEPRFDLSDVFKEQRILVVPLNSGLIGSESARLLGSLITSALWGLTLGRTAVPATQRRPVSIYIDAAPEVFRISGHDLPDALARSRSMNVGWTLIAQHRRQWNPEVLAAIDANARSKVVFATGIHDAKEFASMAPGLLPEDFMALPQYHFYAQLLADGHPTPWVSGKSLPSSPTISDPAEIIRRSQQNYGARINTSDVEADDADVESPPASGVGRRPRRAS